MLIKYHSQRNKHPIKFRMILFLGFTLALIASSFNISDHKNSQDILVRTKKAAPSANVKTNKWPNATVYFTFDKKLESIQGKFVEAMKQVEQNTCVRYIPRTNETDYVLIVKGPKCIEPFGRQGGKQEISINTIDCGVFGFYLHASMQVLGFYHEHQRPDRDQFVQVIEDNIIPEWTEKFQKMNDTVILTNLSKFDVDSIMIYGSYQFSIDPKKPTILKKDGTTIESFYNKTKLSSTDIEAINDYYECKTSGASILTMGFFSILGYLMVIFITNECSFYVELP